MGIGQKVIFKYNELAFYAAVISKCLVHRSEFARAVSSNIITPGNLRHNEPNRLNCLLKCLNMFVHV